MMLKVEDFPFLVFRSFIWTSAPYWMEGYLPVHVPSLEILQIKGCEQLACSALQLPFNHCTTASASNQPALGSAFHLTSITSLTLDGLVYLVSLPPELSRLSQMETLDIWCCDNLKSLANLGLPPKLASFNISGCQIIESIRGAMVSLTQLQCISIIFCLYLKSAEEYTLLTSLQYLNVNFYESWKFPIPKERMHLYASLQVPEIEDIGGPLVSFSIKCLPKPPEFENL